jgi:hypothetical protein
MLEMIEGWGSMSTVIAALLSVAGIALVLMLVLMVAD